MIIPERWVELPPSILSNNTDQDLSSVKCFTWILKIHIELLEKADSSYAMGT